MFATNWLLLKANIYVLLQLHRVTSSSTTVKTRNLSYPIINLARACLLNRNHHILLCGSTFLVKPVDCGQTITNCWDEITHTLRVNWKTLWVHTPCFHRLKPSMNVFEFNTIDIIIKSIEKIVLLGKHCIRLPANSLHDARRSDSSPFCRQSMAFFGLRCCHHSVVVLLRRVVFYVGQNRTIREK